TGRERAVVRLARKSQGLERALVQELREIVAPVPRAHVLDDAPRGDCGERALPVDVGGEDLLVRDVVGAVPHHAPGAVDLAEAEEVGDAGTRAARCDAG